MYVFIASSSQEETIHLTRGGVALVPAFLAGQRHRVFMICATAVQGAMCIATVARQRSERKPARSCHCIHHIVNGSASSHSHSEILFVRVQ